MILVITIKRLLLQKIKPDNIQYVQVTKTVTSFKKLLKEGIINNILF